mmetsp:Transcript_10384/g.32178  ORF Transcript_10384/g.32178 Transcript_10384/m.32178 type:complete len:223 (-) Transcript_10384:526-1194(-)
MPPRLRLRVHRRWVGGRPKARAALGTRRGSDRSSLAKERWCRGPRAVRHRARPLGQRTVRVRPAPERSTRRRHRRRQTAPSNATRSETRTSSLGRPGAHWPEVEDPRDLRFRRPLALAGAIWSSPGLASRRRRIRLPTAPALSACFGARGMCPGRWYERCAPTRKAAPWGTAGRLGMPRRPRVGRCQRCQQRLPRQREGRLPIQQERAAVGCAPCPMPNVST